jgi:predicted secreted protein
MPLTFAFFTFLNAWWIMLFIAIPFSVKYADESENIPANEKYIAAPKTIYWKKAVIIATILAALITLILALVIKSGIVPMKNLI